MKTKWIVLALSVASCARRLGWSGGMRIPIQETVRDQHKAVPRKECRKPCRWKRSTRYAAIRGGRARAKLALAALHAQRIRPLASVFDVGCVWGVNLRGLETNGYHATGFEVSRRILELIDRPNRQLIEADITQPLPDGCASCGGLFALDVIEHLDDSQAAVRQLARLVRNGGVVVVARPKQLKCG